MELFSYLLGKKSGGGGGETGPKVEVKNPLNTTGTFQTNITKIGAFTFNGTSCKSMISGYKALIDVDLSKFNTSNVTDFSWMFSGSNAIEKLDLSSFGESAIEDINKMFNSCTNLKEIDLSNWNTSRSISAVSKVQDIFLNCNSLEKLDMRNFDFTKFYVPSGATGATTIGIFFNSNNNYAPFDTCLVIVKDNTQKQYIQSKCSWVQNIKTVEEYENSI